MTNCEKIQWLMRAVSLWKSFPQFSSVIGVRRLNVHNEFITIEEGKCALIAFLFFNHHITALCAYGLFKVNKCKRMCSRILRSEFVLLLLMSSYVSCGLELIKRKLSCALTTFKFFCSQNWIRNWSRLIRCVNPCANRLTVCTISSRTIYPPSEVNYLYLNFR